MIIIWLFEAVCCAELGGFCLPHSDGCLLLVGGRSCIFGGRWRLVALGICRYIFAKPITSWKTDANQQIILHAHIVRAGFDEKNYACGPIFGTVGKKHQLEIIISCK